MSALPHPLLEGVIKLAHAAGDAILPFWRAGVEVTAKADDSPVTAADLAAHHILLDGLTALDPSIPVLSEEDGNICAPERQNRVASGMGQFDHTFKQGMGQGTHG